MMLSGLRPWALPPAAGPGIAAKGLKRTVVWDALNTACVI